MHGVFKLQSHTKKELREENKWGHDIMYMYVIYLAFFVPYEENDVSIL